MGVSKNNGTPKSSILIGFSSINHPFWGTPIFGNTHISNKRKQDHPPKTVKSWTRRCRHVSRTESEDLRRCWPHRSSRADKHHCRIEGNASEEEAMWRSYWAENPQSKGPDWGIISRWWSSDSGVCRFVAFRIGTDCHLLQKRSGSGNKRGNPCKRPPPSQHPVWPHQNSCWSLPKVQSGAQGDNPWVSDGHR